ncbi:hypothetical protein F5B19DRAFT_350696 [Rostrohypoxylon terebratum]|nr:hypothetical protein F5B19DRAFT_350696 [Rostrohypoxylon terebratum]
MRTSAVTVLVASIGLAGAAVPAENDVNNVEVPAEAPVHVEVGRGAPFQLYPYPHHPYPSWSATTFSTSCLDFPKTGKYVALHEEPSKSTWSKWTNTWWTEFPKATDTGKVTKYAERHVTWQPIETEEPCTETWEPIETEEPCTETWEPIETEPCDDTTSWRRWWPSKTGGGYIKNPEATGIAGNGDGNGDEPPKAGRRDLVGNIGLPEEPRNHDEADDESGLPRDQVAATAGAAGAVDEGRSRVVVLVELAVAVAVAVVVFT